MAESEPLFDFRYFRGIDNVTDPAKLIPSKRGVYLVEAKNVDVDDDGMLHRREGSRVVYAGDCHSMWANRDGSVCLFVQNGDLRRLWPDHTSALILPYVGQSRMSYVEVNDVIYWSNEEKIGYVQNGACYPFPIPANPFKEKMAGGHLIEYYNARLYAAQDTKILYSDPLVLVQKDKRKDFIQMPGRITMMKGVRDGLYVGSAGKTYFLGGYDPLEDGLAMIPVLDQEPFEGAAIKFIDDFGRGAHEIGVIFTTELGNYLARAEGLVTALTPAYFIDGKVTNATAICRDDRGFAQYLAILTMAP